MISFFFRAMVMPLYAAFSLFRFRCRFSLLMRFRFTTLPLRFAAFIAYAIRYAMPLRCATLCFDFRHFRAFSAMLLMMPLL